MHHCFHKIEQIRHITDETFVVRFERHGIEFVPGQHIVVGIKGKNDFRQYSIYSAVNDPWLEILVKEVDHGVVSPMLKGLKPGDELEINGPMGYFSLNGARDNGKPVVLIASGTGIAPFHSFVASYPKLNYTLFHGVRTANEAYERDKYKCKNYVLCTSRDNKGEVVGRVTDALANRSFEPGTLFYLCGNSEMIFDAMDILKNKGIANNQMFAEVYF